MHKTRRYRNKRGHKGGETNYFTQSSIRAINLPNVQNANMPEYEVMAQSPRSSVNGVKQITHYNPRSSVTHVSRMMPSKRLSVVSEAPRSTTPESMIISEPRSLNYINMAPKKATLKTTSPALQRYNGTRKLLRKRKN